MNHILENAYLKVTINDAGAELSGIYDKQRSHEVIWQADPAYWKRHAPVLFPNVGKTWQNKFTFRGTDYPAKQHGFARDMDFTCVSASENSITHVLASSDETLKVYPFPFFLGITQTLSENTLTIQWKVTNPGTETMYFTIGAHPAFNVPVLPDTEQKDYQLLFKIDNPSYILLDPRAGAARPEKTYILKTKDGRCPVGTSTFDNDALIFDNQISWAGIAYPDGTPYVSVSCEDFPNFGIWSAPGAPFICLEPWDGRCDNCGFDDELSRKPGIIAVEAGKSYIKSYTITIH